MENQSSLTPANIYVNATQERFQDTYRRWQGIPSIEVSPAGRIFVNFYSGQDAEVGGNIMMLCVSDDNGRTFRSCATVVEHPDPECRIYDPNLWFDPLGRLWMTYTQRAVSMTGEVVSGHAFAKMPMPMNWSGLSQDALQMAL